MMNSDHIIELFEEVGMLTGQMLAAAQEADWDRLTVLESRCARHIAVLRGTPAPPLPPACRGRKIALIQKILADDRAIRDLVSPWMAELSRRISNTGTERKLQRAYGGV